MMVAVPRLGIGSTELDIATLNTYVSVFVPSTLPTLALIELLAHMRALVSVTCATPFALVRVDAAENVPRPVLQVTRMPAPSRLP